MAEGEQGKTEKVVLDFDEVFLGQTICFGTLPPILCPQDNPEEFKKILAYYNQKNGLAPPCNVCYKTAIYWADPYKRIDEFTEKNIKHLENLVNHFNKFDYHAKLNDKSVSFYFENEELVVSFYEFLKKQLPRYRISGILTWERACSSYRILRKDLWKNPREFLGVEPDVIGP